MAEHPVAVGDVCPQDVSPDIRQSAFALVGDLARVACVYLSPALTQVCPLPFTCLWIARRWLVPMCYVTVIVNFISA